MISRQSWGMTNAQRFCCHDQTYEIAAFIGERACEMLEHKWEFPEFVLAVDIIERLDLERHEHAERFRENHDLDDSIFDEEHIQTWINTADKAFKSWKIHIYEDAVWDMLEIVAFFSVQLARYMRAHWEKTVRGNRETYIMAGIHTKHQVNSILWILDLMELVCTDTSMGNIFLYNLRSLFDKRVR